MLGAILGKAAGKSFLGPLLKGAGSAVLGGAIDRKFNQAALSDRYGYLEGKGLTPQEIAGSGFGASGGTNASQVLGNQSAQLEAQKRQLDVQQAERDKDRALQVRAQDMGLLQTQTSAGATLGAARLNANTAANNLAFNRDVYENVTLPDALRKAVTESPSWKRVQIMASMGVDNILGTAVAQTFGIDPMDPQSLEGLTDQQFLELARRIYGMQSNAYGEASGASLAIGQAAGNVLGRQGSGGGNRNRN